MNEHLYYLAAASFSAARSLPDLPLEHRARCLHGHNFRAQVCAESTKSSDVIEMRVDLARCVKMLDYHHLNELLTVPSDYNLAHWLISNLHIPEIKLIGIHSTANQVTMIGANNNAQRCCQFRFEAAHYLPQVPTGHPCGRLHGHSFAVALHTKTNPDDIDYDQIRAAWYPLQQIIDSNCLNNLSGLENPTSEVLSQWIWQHIRPILPQLSGVTVHETASTGCHYDGDKFHIWKAMRFESAINQHRVHGHSYQLRLHLSAPLNTVMGWIVDYGEVKQRFAPVYEQLDHHLLNELPGIIDVSLEQLVRWIYAQAAPLLPWLERIDLYETQECGVMLVRNNLDAMRLII